MKRKKLQKTILISLLVLGMPIIILAQNVSNKYTVYGVKLVRGACYIANIQPFSGNELQLITMGSVLSVKYNGIVFSGDQSYPLLNEYHITTGASELVREIAINKYELGDSINIVSQHKPVKFPVLKKSDAIKLYPALFSNIDKCHDITYPSIEATFGSFIVNSNTEKCTYNFLSNSLSFDKTTVKKTNINLPGEGKVIMNPDDAVINKMGGLVTIPCGLRVKDKEEKYQEYKNYFFQTYSNDGKLVNSANVNFNYPQKCEYRIYHKSNSEELYVFSGHAVSSKKYKDPEKNNYHVILLDKQGKIIANQPFKFGSADRSILDYTYSFFARGDGYIFMQGFDKQGAVYTLTKLSGDRIVFNKTVHYADIEPNTVGNKENGVKPIITEHLRIQNQLILGDQSIVLIGQILEESNEFSSGTSGSSIPGVTSSKKMLYKNHFLLHYDKDGNFLNQYVLDTYEGNGFDYETYPEIINANRNIVLYYDKMKRIPNELDKKIFANVKARTGLKYITAPVIFTINLTDKKINSDNTFYKQGIIDFNNLPAHFNSGGTFIFYGYKEATEENVSNFDFTRNNILIYELINN